MSNNCELLIPEQIFEVRCIDARAYARKLRRQGYNHEFIVSRIESVWNSDIAAYIRSLEGSGYYKSQEKCMKQSGVKNEV